MDENEYYDQSIQKTSSTLQGQFCPRQVQKGTTSSCSKSRRKIVKDLLSDDCLTYEKHGESEENKFLDIPNVSGVTAKSLPMFHHPVHYVQNSVKTYLLFHFHQSGVIYHKECRRPEKRKNSQGF